MTKEIAIHNLFALKLRSRVTSDREALDMAVKALERQEKTLSYIDRLLNQGTGKKKSLEFLKKYILEGEKNDA